MSMHAGAKSSAGPAQGRNATPPAARHAPVSGSSSSSRSPARPAPPPSDAARWRSAERGTQPPSATATASCAWAARCASACDKASSTWRFAWRHHDQAQKIDVLHHLAGLLCECHLISPPHPPNVKVVAVAQQERVQSLTKVKHVVAALQARRHKGTSRWQGAHAAAAAACRMCVRLLGCGWRHAVLPPPRAKPVQTSLNSTIRIEDAASFQTQMLPPSGSRLELHRGACRPSHTTLQHNATGARVTLSHRHAPPLTPSAPP